MCEHIFYRSPTCCAITVLWSPLISISSSCCPVTFYFCYLTNYPICAAASLTKCFHAHGAFFGYFEQLILVPLIVVVQREQKINLLRFNFYETFRSTLHTWRKNDFLSVFLFFRYPVRVACCGSCKTSCKRNGTEYNGPIRSATAG